MLVNHRSAITKGNVLLEAVGRMTDPTFASCQVECRMAWTQRSTHGLCGWSRPRVVGDASLAERESERWRGVSCVRFPKSMIPLLSHFGKFMNISWRNGCRSNKYGWKTLWFDFLETGPIIISLKNGSPKFQNLRYNKICVTGNFERKYLIHK